MGFFDDYNAAVEAYPDTSMSVEIRNVQYPGTRLNVTEEGTFEVLVRNDGQLSIMNWAIDLSVLNASHGWSAAATTYVNRVQAA
jgi:hypothetical protein